MAHRESRYYRARPLAVLVGVFALMGARCHEAASDPVMPNHSGVATAVINGFDARAELAVSQPLEFLQMCRRNYLAQVKDYRCQFVKHERLNGKLTPKQRIDVLFRETPYSVDMRWVENAAAANHVSFVAGRWVEDGREMMLAYPSGVLGLLLPGGIKRDIHGPRAQAASRRTIDQFGFRNSLDLIIKYCVKAERDPAYSLVYLGTGYFDGRLSFVFERKLPYDGEHGHTTDGDCAYPDRLLTIYMDAEWLVPTGVFAYADDQKKELLGSYQLLNVTFNTGLTDGDF